MIQLITIDYAFASIKLNNFIIDALSIASGE